MRKLMTIATMLTLAGAALPAQAKDVPAPAPATAAAGTAEKTDLSAMSCDELAGALTASIGSLQATNAAGDARQAQMKAEYDKTIGTMTAFGAAQTVLANVPGGGIANMALGMAQPNYDAQLRGVANKNKAAHQAQPKLIVSGAEQVGMMHEEFARRCEGAGQ
jgi:hypothetical protein